MIDGVTINGKHCWNDFKLLLAQKEIGTPEVNTNMVEVPGRNGLLDLSTALTGEITYQNRKITLTFVTQDSLTGAGWASLYSSVAQAFYGQSVSIVFDDYSDYSYSGRCTDMNFKLSNGKRTIELTFDCDPFATKVEATTIYRTLSTSQVSVTLTNNGRPVVPTITVESSTTLIFGSYTTTLSAGTWTVPSIRLANGENTIKAKATDGSGKVTFTWNEVTL